MWDYQDHKDQVFPIIEFTFNHISQDRTWTDAQRLDSAGWSGGAAFGVWWGFDADKRKLWEIAEKMTRSALAPLLQNTLHSHPSPKVTSTAASLRIIATPV